MTEPIFRECDILLPGFDVADADKWTKWAVVACDQFTCDKGYWRDADALAGDSPSTLRLILPEAFLDLGADELAVMREKIAAAMRDYAASALKAYPSSMVYVERTLPDGAVRRGIVGAFDLDAYDYAPGSEPKIRATEGTVLSRVPPRVEIRRSAPFELPHIMVLFDDPSRSVIEPLAKVRESLRPVYDFGLMLGGGHIRGWLLGAEETARVKAALAPIEEGGFPYAMGDGNHSFAAAKAYREELRASLTPEEAASHPSRFALAELVNVRDEALVFEPIHRAVFGCDPSDVLRELRKFTFGGEGYIASDGYIGDKAVQKVRYVTESYEGAIAFGRTTHPLTVGTLQDFLDEYAAAHPEVTVTYIHGAEEVRTNTKRADAVGFILGVMGKDELFPAVERGGALPRKTFSMGEARSKRYYVEGRKIVNSK